MSDNKAVENNKIDATVEKLRQELAVIELGVETEGPTLPSLLRKADQAKVTKQEIGGWGDGDTACSASAIYLVAKAEGLLEE